MVPPAALPLYPARTRNASELPEAGIRQRTALHAPWRNRGAPASPSGLLRGSVRPPDPAPPPSLRAASSPPARPAGPLRALRAPGPASARARVASEVAFRCRKSLIRRRVDPTGLPAQVVRAISRAIPLTPVIEGLRTILHGSPSLSDLLPQLAAIAAWILVSYTIGIRTFRREETSR